MDIAQSMEAASTQIHESMSGQVTSLQKPAEVCKVGLQSQQYKSNSYRCGKSNHQPAHCPFRTTRCHYCGKVGHIKIVVCKQASKDEKWIKKEPHGHPIRTVQEDSQELKNAFNHIRTEPGQPYKVDLQIDRKSYTMEV